MFLLKFGQYLNQALRRKRPDLETENVWRIGDLHMEVIRLMSSYIKEWFRDVFS